ncbi:MAG: SH3 domain-containing protein [Sphingobacterium sp.]
MSLQTKYQTLIDTAKSSGMMDLVIAELDGVLHIRGTAPNGDVKNKLWDVYNQIDPNFFSRDVEMNVYVSPAVVGSQVRVIIDQSNLNIRKGPGTDLPIIGYAAKDEIITLITRATSQWWLVRTEQGEEGYCYAQYLQPVE